MRTGSVVCLLTTFLLTTVSAQAQQRNRIPRIGYVTVSTAAAHSTRVEALRQGLQKFGYVDGKSILIEYRFAEGNPERLVDLVAELVKGKVDIIVAAGDPGARAAKSATNTIPVVMVSVGTDPVETGLVESIARPGGNITGFTNLTEATAGKRLELFKETIPKLESLAVLYDASSRSNSLETKELQTAARPLGLAVQSWEVRAPSGFDGVFGAIVKSRPHGLYVPASGLLRSRWQGIVGFALENRLPSMYSAREAVDVGGLMSYGPDQVDQYRRAATYVDKILKGTKPAELPVERPMKFELAFNLKTAKQVGLTIPPQVLARAEKVIR